MPLSDNLKSRDASASKNVDYSVPELAHTANLRDFNSAGPGHHSLPLVQCTKRIGLGASTR